MPAHRGVPGPCPIGLDIPLWLGNTNANYEVFRILTQIPFSLLYQFYPNIDYMTQFKGWLKPIQENWDGEIEPYIQRGVHFQIDFETLFWCTAGIAAWIANIHKLKKSSKQPCAQMHMSVLWAECLFSPKHKQISYFESKPMWKYLEMESLESNQD